MLVVDFWHFLTIWTLIFINKIRSAYLLWLLEEIIEVLYLEQYFKHDQAMRNPLKMFFFQSVHNWIVLFFFRLRFKYDLFSEWVCWLELESEKTFSKRRKILQPPYLPLRQQGKESGRRKRCQGTTSWQLCWGKGKIQWMKRLYRMTRQTENLIKDRFAPNIAQKQQKTTRAEGAIKLTMMIPGLSRTKLRTTGASPQ